VAILDARQHPPWATPEITTCPGALKLTASHHLTLRGLAARFVDIDVLESHEWPAHGALTPAARPPASIQREYFTKSTAGPLKSKVLAATSAVNSPRLWPAIISRLSAAAFRATSPIGGGRRPSTIVG